MNLYAYYTDAPGGSASTAPCAAGRLAALLVGPNKRLSFQTR